MKKKVQFQITDILWFSKKFTLVESGNFDWLFSLINLWSKMIVCYLQFQISKSWSYLGPLESKTPKFRWIGAIKEILSGSLIFSENSVFYGTPMDSWKYICCLIWFLWILGPHKVNGPPVLNLDLR
jgi:hypothetical protein